MRMIVDNIHPKYAVENCVGSQREVLRVPSGSPGEVAATRRTALKVESEIESGLWKVKVEVQEKQFQKHFSQKYRSILANSTPSQFEQYFYQF